MMRGWVELVRQNENGRIGNVEPEQWERVEFDYMYVHSGQLEIESQEIQDIIHDIDIIIEEEGVKIDGKTLRAIIVLAQMNIQI